jgi:hypothetical protein
MGYIVGLGIFAVIAVLVVWVGVTRMRRASKGE